MKIFNACLWLTCLNISSPAVCFALLSPLYESVSEFKALINDERLIKTLDSGELIIEIKREKNVFLVTTNLTTNQRQIYIEVIYEKNKVIGPAVFHLVFPEK